MRAASARTWLLWLFMLDMALVFGLPDSSSIVSGEVNEDVSKADF